MRNDILHERRSFDNVRELVEWAASTYKDDTAYSYKEKPHDKEIVKKSFVQLREDVRALGASFIKLGLRGKHCAVIGKFSYSWVRVYFALLSIGAVIVPLDRDWSAEDLSETMLRADAEYLFIDADLESKKEYILGKCNIDGFAYMSCTEGETVDSLVNSGNEIFEQMRSEYFDYEIDAKKLALLVFTSGTTGKGKGVMLSQNAVLSDLSDIIPYIDFGKKTVGVLPPHHTFCSSVMFIGHTMIGTEIYISAGLRYVAKELREQKPEHLILVPLYLETFYRKMQTGIKEQGKEKLVRTMMKVSNLLRKVGIDLRKKFFASLSEAMGGNVKMIITGGAPISAEIVNFFDGIGITTLNGYGITECAPIISVNHSKRVVGGSVGFVLDMDTVKIDEPNEDGEGEILVKGPNVMLGYFKDEDATKDAFDEDGYFRTGDYGKIGKGGALFITGRKKNLIILSNGKNVYPEEIENEFVAIPGVIDIIVYEGKSRRGMDHNAIVAEIYPDKEYLEKNGIDDAQKYFKQFIDEFNRTAVPYKKIGVLKVREEEFPKNTLRKILRFKLDMTID